jgi:hypothetical protein
MRAELKQIRGIGDTTAERLRRDHGVETIAGLARLSDTEVGKVQDALRASSSHVKNGDVARWREQARQLVRDQEAVPDEPLATFVVEALKPAGDGGHAHFVVHHVEGGQTLETSEPTPTIDDAVRWMQERVIMPPAPLPGKPPSGHPEVVHPSAPGHAAARRDHLSRRGRLRITALQVHRARNHPINGAVMSLLAGAPVVIEDGSALVFVGHVSLEGAEGQPTCQMRCRLQRIDSGQEVTFAWGGEMVAAPGMQSATISSTPVSIPSGAYRGLVFAEDLGQDARRAFCELSLLVVI